MQLNVEKGASDATDPPATPNPDCGNGSEISARMHFYAVHNRGEQLRRGKPGRTTGRTTGKHDRMTGR